MTLMWATLANTALAMATSANYVNTVEKKPDC